MNLVIVESPTKAKTISRFLSGDFLVLSSYGHVRDLPKSKLGVDVEKDFQPTYVIPDKSKKIVEGLEAKTQESQRIILATDEDREGEAIAWHLVQALGLDAKQIPNSKFPASAKASAGRQIPRVERIVFHEITEQAILEALKNPRGIDMRLVDAQQARRVLDRLVGYELSPFLWKKIAYGLSAGRVQSVALRLIVEREREIEKFKPEEYWSISAMLKLRETGAKQKRKTEAKPFEAALVKIDGETIPQFGIKTKEEAERIVEDLERAKFEVEKVEKKETKRRPLPPFTTSTLQQEAWRRLRFSAKQTMMLSQRLYEGIDLGKGQVGLITYMRTDSTNLSEESLRTAKSFLEKELGSEYASSAPRRFKTKSRLSQEAHEAIRPTEAQLTPESLKGKMDSRQWKLYDLIWRRFVASQMPEAIFESTVVDIKALSSGTEYALRANGLQMRFDGFLKIWPSKIEETSLPPLHAEDRLDIKEVIPSQHFTEPPARYNDASLVKAMEEYGIGRPSTYAPTISTIEARRYVERNEKRYFVPTTVGVLVTDLLTKHFEEIVDYGFTAKMEEELDEIAEGKRPWAPAIREFYEPFHKNLLVKEKEVTRKEASERPSDEVCDKCGRPMVIKVGRYGPFLACSGYPECSNIKKIPKPSLGKCPTCSDGEVVMRRTKARKRIFYGCTKWPTCNFASWRRPVIDAVAKGTPEPQEPQEV